MSKTNDLKWLLISKCQYLLNELLIGQLDFKVESYLEDFVNLNLNELSINELKENENINDIFNVRIRQLDTCERKIKEGNFGTAISIILNLYYDMNLDIAKNTKEK